MGRCNSCGDRMTCDALRSTFPAMTLIAIKPRRPSLARNTYLTDGVRLFRVEGTIDNPWWNGWALLEDCRTLDSDFYTAQQLETMRLETVKAG